MRKIQKRLPPQVLIDNRADWDMAVSERPTDYHKNKYRHPDIKALLMEETACKCVYCESKVGYNCPGDIEHKIPKSQRLDLIFEWDNLTIACTECNRRKSTYYKPECMFLDPYTDDVEETIWHRGPAMFSVPGNERTEITLKILELNRKDLLGYKIERLEAVKNLIERISGTQNNILQQVLIDELLNSCSL